MCRHNFQIQKNQPIDLQDQLERNCNVPPVFGFNSIELDINLMKNYLLPLVAIERGFEPIVIKKASEFVAFRFGDIQLLNILNSLGGTTNHDFFFKTHNTSEVKHFFPYKWFKDPEKLNKTQLPAYKDFFSKLRNNELLEKDFSGFQGLINAGLTSKEALCIVQTEIGAATCNWGKKLSIPDQCVSKRSHVYLQKF